MTLPVQVLIVASEAVPLVKTGGLGDVITALASALRVRGIDATILMPGYPAALEGAGTLREVGQLDNLPGGPGRLLHGLLTENVPVVLLDTERFRVRTANPYVDREGAEYSDNAICFASLAHAAVEICAGRTGLPVPHVVHANDWHAGLIPALLRVEGITNVGSLLTIHNLAFQGNYPMGLAPELGIPAEMLTPDAMEFWGQVSFLKAGIRFADRISTVSKTYAQEILTPRFGHGMDGVLDSRKEALVATPNGIDAHVWNSSSDPLIARNFSIRDMKGKAICKRDLQAQFGLPQDPFAPVLALGSRITHQKMADVALAALPGILERHPRLQVIILGCGDHGYEHGFQQLAAQYPDRVGVYIGYDERRAHALHAGADMLLHGTRFEPFGLTPIYSMRYGTIPIATRVGGLIDTVIDAGASGAAAEGSNGILFDGEEPQQMAAAVERAFELFGHSGDWQAMQRNAMAVDFSWSGPAEQYIRLYQEIAPAAAKTLFAQTQPEVPPQLPKYMAA
ncbi:MAG: starch synthase [Burkholderiales bacterium]|jgi:starch synthase